MKTDSVMIDLETLDTVATGTILSIGAVKFDLNGDYIDDEGFYASVSIDSNTAVGRTISEATLEWWMGQPPAARQVFSEPKQPLEAALESLSEWFGNDDNQLVWSNGASFDIPMLEHAYRSFNWEPPWKFWNARCMRTYRALPVAAGLKLGNDHHALRDAVNQAKLVQQIHQRLMSKAAA